LKINICNISKINIPTIFIMKHSQFVYFFNLNYRKIKNNIINTKSKAINNCLNKYATLNV